MLTQEREKDAGDFSWKSFSDEEMGRLSILYKILKNQASTKKPSMKGGKQLPGYLQSQVIMNHLEQMTGFTEAMARGELYQPPAGANRGYVRWMLQEFNLSEDSRSSSTLSDWANSTHSQPL